MTTSNLQANGHYALSTDTVSQEIHLVYSKETLGRVDYDTVLTQTLEDLLEMSLCFSGEELAISTSLMYTCT